MTFRIHHGVQSSNGGTQEITDPGVCPFVTSHLTLKQTAEDFGHVSVFASPSSQSFTDDLEKTTRANPKALVKSQEKAV